jgi:hypothetical protein
MFYENSEMRNLFNEITLTEDDKWLTQNNLVKTHTFKRNGQEESIKYQINRNVFDGLYYTTLYGGEFDNLHGRGKTEEEALNSLKIRLFQLRDNKLNHDQF